MFKVLKEKLSKAIKSISEKTKEKDEPHIDETLEKMEKEPEFESKLEKDTVRADIAETYVEAAESKEQVVDKTLQEETKSVKDPVEKKSFIKKVFEKATKKITEKMLEEKDLIPILDGLEVDLIEADVAVDVAERLSSSLKETLVGKEIKKGKEEEFIVESFKNAILDILSVPDIDLKQLKSEKTPTVLLFIGFNGAGKTTSIAKVANWLKKNGITSVIAAGDTFRAASIEQLEEHAKNIGVKVVKHKYGGDPAAVVYDAIDHAKAKGIQFVLADSAGRVHTNENLMKELKKIVKVNKPDLKVLVIDSLTGNDALYQARAFGEIGVDAVIFTKVDVNEKGGSILSVTNELKKPILFLGMGQKYDEFEKFNAESFVAKLLE